MRGNPVRKSGVSASFLPEKTNRHRITRRITRAVSVHHSCPKRRTDTGLRRKDELTPDYAGLREKTN